MDPEKARGMLGGMTRVFGLFVLSAIILVAGGLHLFSGAAIEWLGNCFGRSWRPSILASLAFWLIPGLLWVLFLVLKGYAFPPESKVPKRFLIVSLVLLLLFDFGFLASVGFGGARPDSLVCRLLQTVF